MLEVILCSLSWVCVFMISKSFLIQYSIPLACILGIIDRFSKSYVVDFLRSVPEKTIPITSFFNITQVWNYGVSFGMFKADTSLGVLILMAVCFTIILFLGFILLKSETKAEALAFSFIIGGAIGNLYDRIVYHAVYDFLDFHYAGIHFWTFNPADVFITIGAIFLIIDQIIRYKKSQKQQS